MVKQKLSTFSLLSAMILVLGGCMTGSYYDSPPLPVLDEPPTESYRELGAVSTLIDMRVGGATWRSIVNYRLASQAQQQFGQDANAVVMLSYLESPRHAMGTGMAISFSPGQGMIGNEVASKTKPSAAKPAPDVNDGLRTVVLYRENRTLKSGASYRVIWQGNSLGYLSNGSTLRVRLPPGNQTLSVSYNTTKAPYEQSVVIADNSETYLLLRLNFSFSEDPNTYMRLVPVSPAAGRAAVGMLGL